MEVVAPKKEERTLLQDILWAGDQVAYLSCGCYSPDLEQVYGLRFSASRDSLIPRFKGVWGRAVLPWRVPYIGPESNTLAWVVTMAILFLNLF